VISPIPIFIGSDPSERTAVTVLMDSLLRHSSQPLAITPLVSRQLQGLLWRSREPTQSTDFAFSRFLVPCLMGYAGWAMYLDGDMLARSDISELWALRDPRFAVQCVQHQHIPTESTKFGGAIQTRYPRKNWSSLMLLNCSACKALTPELVNAATGLHLHRFQWLDDPTLIGALPMGRWNHLVDVEPVDARPAHDGGPALVHWTLGGPWLHDYSHAGGPLAEEWHAARAAAISAAPGLDA
jgi:hypothetical protein